MPCFRCGVRQTDPVRGASPWKRGVRADRQVLVCPACQAACDWTADLDRCAACDSVVLFRRLGEIECRACGHVRSADRRPEAANVGETSNVGEISETSVDGEAPGLSETSVDAEAPGLSEEVARALDRVFKKRPLT